MAQKILIVEDEPLILGLYVRVLKQPRRKLLTAQEEIEAVRIIRQERPALVLLDLMIPTLKQRSALYSFHDPVGYEVLRAARLQIGNSRETKIIIMSNLDSDEHRRRCRELGADDFWVKASFDPHELSRRVDAVLAAT